MRNINNIKHGSRKRRRLPAHGGGKAAPIGFVSPQSEMSRVAFLQKRFDLTPQQARLVIHLVRGASLRSCASALGISYETSRRHLKAILKKTGTHRQAELILAAIIAYERHKRSRKKIQ